MLLSACELVPDSYTVLTSAVITAERAEAEGVMILIFLLILCAAVMPQSATYDAKQVAVLWGRHVMSVYRDARAGGVLPVAPIRIGASLRWPRTLVNRSVGLADDADPFAEKQKRRAPRKASA
jgi:hypothetical protein